jgi:sporulation integral membrane protein YlbJ
MLRTVLLGIFSFWLVTAIIREPDVAFQAALQGLDIWWKIVFPGLLPFLILSELLFAFGAVHALGALLDPVMRRWLGLPGTAGWALALGWIAGYPAGAEAAASLRAKGLLNKEQGQRLLSASYMPSPVLMIVVIGAGFLRRPDVGITIAIAVWGSSLLLMLLYAWLGRTSSAAEHVPSLRRRESLWMFAALSMAEAHRQDGRSFGKAMGDAVTSSVQKLMSVGGYMIASSVFAAIASSILPPDWQAALAYPGLYEVHLGAYEAARSISHEGAAWTAAAIAAVLAWGGWSVLLQARSAVSSTDLAFFPLFVSRLGHAALACGLAVVLWNPVSRIFPAVIPGLSEISVYSPSSDSIITAKDLPSLWPAIPAASASLLLLTSLLVIVSILLAGRKRSA